MHLSNNTILITGGTSGIGKSLTKKFLDLNNRIIVISSNEKNLANLQNELPQIETAVCNLAEATAVKALVDRLHFEYQDLNILVNNAGIQFNYQWLDSHNRFSNKIEQELRVNLISPLELIYGALPLLKTKEQAAVINVSSVLAIVPKQSAPVYCASKAGVHAATKAIRYQLEGTKIKIFEIIPPLVDTPMTIGRGTGKITPDQLVDEFIENFKKDKFESSIGKAKWLRLLQRIAPGLADGLLKHQ